MNSFIFHNPTKIIFGEGTISKLSELVPSHARILLLFGQGSIYKNGIYNQVVKALGKRVIFEQGGIQSNPSHEQCMNVVKRIAGKNITFILAVGGGSVIDAAKYISVASQLLSPELAWDIIERKTPVNSALPIGVVLTLPASGSEMNANAVISNNEKKVKRSLKSHLIFPLFAILDPKVTQTLLAEQIANGIVDAYSHVIEQYLTFQSNSLIQDRFSEGILLTLYELGSHLVNNSYDFDMRANLMWATTCALNGYISCGVPQDWSSHMISHELTANFDISHADAIGIVLPGVMNYMKKEKADKIIQYGKRVFGLSKMSDERLIQKSIELTENFFISLGQHVRLSDFGLGKKEAIVIATKIGQYPVKLGERRNIGKKEVKAILLQRV